MKLKHMVRDERDRLMLVQTNLTVVSRFLADVKRHHKKKSVMELNVRHSENADCIIVDITTKKNYFSYFFYTKNVRYNLVEVIRTPRAFGEAEAITYTISL